MKIILLFCCLTLAVGMPVFSAEPRTESSASERSSTPPQFSRTAPESPVKREDFGLQPSSLQCVYPGQIIALPIKPDAILANQKWFIQAETAFIKLQAVSQQKQQSLFLLPTDSRIKPLQVYSVFAQSESSSTPQAIPLEIRTCGFTQAAPPARKQSGHNVGEIILLMASDALLAVTAEVEREGYVIVEQYSLQQLQQSLLIVRTEATQLEPAMQQLRRQFPFVKVDRNDHYQTSAEPRLYANEKINWRQLHDCSLNVTAPLKIGIIDGVIAVDHSSLVGQNIHQKLFTRAQTSTDKDHATAIAVLLAGNKQNPALTGLITEVELLAASVLEQSDYGAVATTEAIGRALDWLISHQVRLINISLSGTRPNSVLNKLLDLTTARGLLIFAAAGNDKLQHTDTYPAAHPRVFAITAIDAANRVYPFANRGDYLDFAAPGVDIWTASSDGPGQYRSGTSFAVPYAVAVVAHYLQLNPNVSRDILYNTIRSYSEDLGAPGHDAVFGWGLIKLPENICQR